MHQTNCKAHLLQVQLYPKEHPKGLTKPSACTDLKLFKKTMVILLLDKLDQAVC